jgi:metal-responsive CopG/Arc/MetJ family transcriptional regulator
MMRKVKTAISIDDHLLTETAKIAEELAIPRSQVVSLALEDYINRYRNRQLLEQINEAYADAPDADETGTRDIIRAQQRKLRGRGEWK